MNGAESLVRTLLACGVDTCFANPGTSEMHFVAALDRIPGMRCILGLFEGAVTGMADGYGRMAGRPAATLLHCGPGLANGLANLHNARRAGSTVLNCVGDQATHHRPLDAPLTADSEALARTVSAWVRTATVAAQVGADAAAAVQAARTGNGQIATLILPSDTCWDEGGAPAQPLPAPPALMPAPVAIDAAARLLRSNPGTLILLGQGALDEAALRDAQRIAAATGARLMADTFFGRMARGRGRVPVERVPYSVDQAIAALSGIRHVVLVGTKPPVGFFAYPGRPGRLLPPDAEIATLARPEHDIPSALDELAATLGAPPAALSGFDPPPAPIRGALSPETLGASLAALMPDDAIVVDEAISLGWTLFAATRAAAAHDWLMVPGGAIGGGPPLAAGAAVGAPGRRVVALQADGSAMYTLQALWTQARENLDVTTILLNNRSYAILRVELGAVGAVNYGPTALGMIDLTRPDLDWIRLAQGMGVEAARAGTVERFADLFAQSLERQGPFLIDAAIA